MHDVLPRSCRSRNHPNASRSTLAWQDNHASHGIDSVDAMFVVHASRTPMRQYRHASVVQDAPAPPTLPPVSPDAVSEAIDRILSERTPPAPSRRVHVPRVSIPHPFRSLFGESRAVTWAAIILVAMLSLMLVRPAAMSLFSFQRTAGLVTERRAEVAALQARNDALHEQLDYYRTDAFVAERARTYGMIRPGEQSYVVRELVHPESAVRYATSRLRSIAAAPTATATPDQPQR
jgi:cell division protein FtsB